MGELVPVDSVERSIIEIRGVRVILDADLAALYGVETKALTRAVRRNPERFPADFMFQLAGAEFAHLRRQSGTSSQWGGRRYPPLAFTEHGVAMLSSVLRSERAAEVNIAIMRAFVQLRRAVVGHEELAGKLDALEKRYDQQFRVVFDAIRQLMAPSAPDRHPIGFTPSDEASETGDP
jgi:hypothetical protein